MIKDIQIDAIKTSTLVELIQAINDEHILKEDIIQIMQLNNNDFVVVYKCRNER